MSFPSNPGVASKPASTVPLVWPLVCGVPLPLARVSSAEVSVPTGTAAVPLDAAAAATESDDFAVDGREWEVAGFFVWPLSLDFVVARGGDLVAVDALGSNLSCALLADAAVGRVMRSRKLPPPDGLVSFLAGGGAASAVREPGRWLDAREERVGLCDFVAAEDAVRDERGAVEERKDCWREVGALDSCFAREAAVGAVRRDGRSTGLVPSRGLGLVVLGEVAWTAGAVADFAAEEAVGAVRELRLGFDRGAFATGDLGVTVFGDDVAGCEVIGEGFFICDVGDLRDEETVGLLAACVLTGVGLKEVLADDFRGDGSDDLIGVDFADSFPDNDVRDVLLGVDLRGLLIGDAVFSALLADALADSFFGESFASAGGVEGLRSSTAGGSASPPLTAAALDSSAGFISAGSSSAAVTGLSGFAGGLSSLLPFASCLDSSGLSCTTAGTSA